MQIAAGVFEVGGRPAQGGDEPLEQLSNRVARQESATETAMQGRALGEGAPSTS